MATYRPNVAAILRKPKSGKILICERLNHSGSWQFPQGGVDKGEDLIGALVREVEEEIGVTRESYQITACRTNYRYKFPEGHLKKGLYCGQTQTYFLCDYTGKKKAIILDAHVREFSSFKWIYPDEFDITWVPKFKRPVFRRVFKDFFGIRKLPSRRSD
ncbi:MAG: RNA pyrophosphohydrolase [Verrucomicrobiales bacterium]|nr:RNA pyrophosphohydrolase [Verrucomicrobiales bacterium]